MAKTVSENIQDDIIGQDVDLARVDAALQKQIGARLDKLGRDLKLLTTDIDPHGTPRRSAQVVRMQKLDRESRELIRAAYADINRMTTATLVGVGEAQSMLIADSLEENIP